ncbi:MAG TPA: RlpA-like double-psi beta-barrel domain-containing protein [Methyloceanibacter sp.]|jgi:rare lipoprotein A
MSNEKQWSASHRVNPLVLCFCLALCGLTGEASAKKPGSTYCFNGICHRVQTLAETKMLIGREETVRASFYDDCKVDRGNPCTKLSSGEELRADLADNAASPVYPDGTILVLSNPKNSARARVRINNSGPYVKGRLLDVSRATAEQLGFINTGVAELRVRVVGPLGK